MMREVISMSNVEHDVLQLLKDELDMIEKGGYGRSVKTPWKATSIFQDSLTCLNYGYPYKAYPCSECFLTGFVPPENLGEAIQCHHIPLNESGDTIEVLESQDNQKRLEDAVKSWLKQRIAELEKD
jgi:hypothetical protein